MSWSRAIGIGLEPYKTPSKRQILDPRMSCAMACAVPIFEVWDLSSFFIEKIRMNRLVDSGLSVDFGRKPR